MIIAEFNRITVGFWVSAVTRIHRISWQQVESPSGLVKSKAGYAVGVIKLQEKIIFLLDFEKIASVINPESGIQDVNETRFEPSQVSFNRSSKKVLIAEDSPYILKLLSAYTEEAGYQTQTFSNGQEAWDYIASRQQYLHRNLPMTAKVLTVTSWLKKLSKKA